MTEDEERRLIDQANDIYEKQGKEALMSWIDTLNKDKQEVLAFAHLISKIIRSLSDGIFDQEKFPPPPSNPITN